jgi:hypothetical protein
VSVRVIAPPARITPIKFVLVSVTASCTHQDTSLARPPPVITRLKSVAVRAPPPPVPTMMIHFAPLGPFSVNVVVRTAAALKQYVPGESVTPPSVPLTGVHTRSVRVLVRGRTVVVASMALGRHRARMTIAAARRLRRAWSC